ncbi:MAG: M23 family metallopeptidase, partial [Desulfitobacteriaceae bacterium]|nr:M23 family metallopeptidase [Desulfitobacteriaceae bacterium]
VAAAAGTVVSAGWDGGYGKMILIDHGNGVMTRYAHSSQLLVSVGQRVAKGQTIGLVGVTGNTTGPHLHFEVISNGSTLNPLSYLP